MNVNIITGKTGEQATQSTQITPREFWEHYLQLIETRGSTHLTSRERRLMVFILSRPDALEQSYFCGEYARAARLDLGYSAQELSRMKRQLIAKGFLVGGEHKGQAHPSKALCSLKRYIDTQGQINFVFPFTIADDNDRP